MGEVVTREELEMRRLLRVLLENARTYGNEAPQTRRAFQEASDYAMSNGKEIWSRLT